MSNFTDYIGGGGSASYPTIFLSKSQTWVPFQDGNICIHVIGGGGGGGVTANNNNFSGGGAGGYTKKNSLAVTTSGSFTVVIGAAGQAGYTTTNGTAGGETSVSGTGLSAQLRSVGGDAGLTGSSATRSGGSGNGGDVTNDGGSGNMFGGGAVGLLGNGQSAFNLNQVPMAGQVDVLGDFWSSSMGQFAGGPRSYGCWASPIALRSPEIAGPLSGGAAVRQVAYSGNIDVRGGAASIGGGGGGGRSTSAGYTRGGDGGVGIVVIQYIP